MESAGQGSREPGRIRGLRGHSVRSTGAWRLSIEASQVCHCWPSTPSLIDIGSSQGPGSMLGRPCPCGVYSPVGDANQPFDPLC